MYRIHHLEQSRSHRIVWLAEELGLNYELITYQRDPNTLCAPKQLREIHPLGKAPILENNGQIINESAAIIDYLFNHNGSLHLRPPYGSKNYDTYQYWMYYAEGSVMPLLYARLVLSRSTKPPVPSLLRPVTRKVISEMNHAYFHPELKRLIDYLTDHLSNQPYFAGEHFTAADIQMAYPILALSSNNLVFDDWLARIRERPAQQRAEAKGAGIVLPEC